MALKPRKRHRLRRKEADKLLKDLSTALGITVGNVVFDVAEAGELRLLYFDGEVLGILVDEGPFLTVRGLLRYSPKKRFVTVDMGAVEYVCNGADVMAPGIVEADVGIRAGDLVWVRDERNKQPLAVGIALMAGADMVRGQRGKAIKSIHYVGDELWNLAGS